MAEKNRLINRRQFVADVSKTLIAAELANESIKAVKANDASFGLNELTASTEKTGEKIPEKWSQEKKIKFAVIGLGHLSLEEILPAFSASQKAIVTALVSGDREKALRVAKSYNAGKHVLCEKPMATSSRDCRTMIDVCKQHDRKLMIAYRMQ